MDRADPDASQRRFASGVQKFKKAIYTEFTDSTFTTQKTKPPWAGIQGPTIRAVVNDRVVVHFKNLASQNYSISPIGVPYWKQSEGAGYDDSSSLQEREDDAVLPGGYYKYVWDIHPNSGPTVTDPECLTYSYSSQVDIVRDLNSGLIGAFLICKSGALTEERERKVAEFVLLFAVFDESKSWYRELSRADKPRKTSSRQFHTINGYINSTLPGLKLCLKSPVVSWHLIGLGSTPDIHTIQFQDHTLKVMDHRRVTVEITPMTFTMALMRPYTEGKFQISCKIHSHQQAGMSAFFTVEDCPEPMEVSDKRTIKHAEDEEEEGDEAYSVDDLFSTIVFQPGMPPSILRSAGSRRPKVWVHYISAEEVTWDYNPQSDRLSFCYRSSRMAPTVKRWGKVYKKVVYVEYTDKTFTVRKSKSNSLIGPVLRGEVEDQFQIIFKNMASRPYNIYPNGLASIQPLKKKGKEKQVDLRSLAVPPGEIMMYLWTLTAEDAPADADPRCLTRLYHSTVDPERDVASGLVGPLIICKSQSLDKRGKVVRPLIFSVFDENKSWYLEENIQTYIAVPSKVDRNDPRFYKSNVKYSVNGLINNSLQLKTCAGEVMLWHVASVGMDTGFLSVYFTGNPFEKDRTYGTVLTLFPMTGDTVTIEMETEGKGQKLRHRLSVTGIVSCNSGNDEVTLELKPNITERSRRETWGVGKDGGEIPQDVLSENDILKDSVLEVDKLVESLDPHGYTPKHRRLIPPPKTQYFPSNSSANQTQLKKTWHVEYDDYESEGNESTLSFSTWNEMDIRSTESKFRSYYIAAVEILWNYGIEKPPHLLSPRWSINLPDYRPKTYKKVVYREYHDKEFQNPVKRGELDEHLGIMGPVLKAEVNDVLTVVFKNLASRPYSLFGPGVSPGEGLRDGEAPGDPVPPGEERVYNWRITKRQGPYSKDFDCKAGAYYSTVDMEKDINSGLIGPLLICRPGTLQPRFLLQPGVQDLFLLFTIFDERKSWYLDYNIKEFCTPPCQAKVDDPWFEFGNRFAAINGYVAESLPGLEVAQHQTSRWHLLNVGSGGEFHAVHFHGIPFSVGKDQEHRLGVFNLYPGVFGTIEMRPTIVGTWLVECTIGEHQLSGMRAKLLVYNPCILMTFPLLGNWVARLARLHLSGSINAWIGSDQDSWIQVDLLRPMVVHGIQTQGVKTSMRLSEMFTVIFTISYSLDQQTWRTYRGNSSEPAYKFNGNMDGYRIKENLLTPPIIGRYIRIHPFMYSNRPALRFELLGCDLNSCSLPLGMQRKLIPNSRISASSFHQSWMLSWSPDLARLNQEGRANAWRPKTNNPHEWLQVDFEVVKRVTGILTQGAKSMLTHMMVTEFTVSVSDDGRTWSTVTEQGTKREKIFEGNSDHNEERLNLFEPPLFMRFIRIHPKGWINDIALRVEFLGCDTQQRQ
uniref:Coagulation factor VIII, procoagulant component n=1 Tax=Pygocentrus nattereri TaxID=42514 RepID=A0AAR2KQL0_PYGNA